MLLFLQRLGGQGTKTLPHRMTEGDGILKRISLQRPPHSSAFFGVPAVLELPNVGCLPAEPSRAGGSPSALVCGMLIRGVDSRRMTQFDPKRVFGPSVDNYIKYRPGYPVEVVDTLRAECGLDPDWHVADIGSGTGLLARLFLDFGCRVTGVEPNEEMCLAGDQMLARYPRFSSLPGSAESTGISDASVELVSAGMAFHWFDISRAQGEFRRILVPGGWVALVWNRVLTGPAPFLQGYTALVHEYSPGWTETRRRDQPISSLDLPGFFGGEYRRAGFSIQQHLDWDGLVGRTLSIAHAPKSVAPHYEPMLADLRAIFDCHQQAGQVPIDYETELYYGRLPR
jgi:SAM-dependent methyltransferase